MNLPCIQKMFFVEGRDHFTHAEELCVGWVILGLSTGRFRYALDEQPPDECHPGDLVIARPGQTLRRTITRKADFYALYFDWEEGLRSCLGGKYTPLDIPRCISTLSYWKQMWRQGPQALSLQRRDTLLYDFLQQLEYESHQPRIQGVNDSDRQIFRIAEFLRNTEAPEYSLAELSRKVGVSPSQASRRFHAVFGVTPVTYRTQHKLQKACQYLLNTDWTTERIAETCGFSNAFYFSRVFSRQMGCPPREYRKTHAL